MNISGKSLDKVGSGHNITKINERYYSRGSLMFIEGELSREMFIIRSGKVRILKQEGDKTVELATLGPGSVIGELSLLDHQPRSATAQVVEDLFATVISENLFNNTMKTIPEWLSNIIQVVVKRLRDTMKKTGESIVQKSIAGVIKILLLLYNSESTEHDSEKRISLNRAKEVISSTIGIGDIETESVLLHLIFKNMIFIRKDDAGKEYINLIDDAVLQLYMNYLRASQRGTKLLGQDLSTTDIELLQIIFNAGEKSGKNIKPGIIQIGIPQIEIEMQRQEKGKNIDINILDNLIEANVLFKEQNVVKTRHQTHKRTVVIYIKNILEKLLILHLWLPRFNEEILF